MRKLILCVLSRLSGCHFFLIVSLLPLSLLHPPLTRVPLDRHHHRHLPLAMFIFLSTSQHPTHLLHHLRVHFHCGEISVQMVCFYHLAQMDLCGFGILGILSILSSGQKMQNIKSLFVFSRILLIPDFSLLLLVCNLTLVVSGAKPWLLCMPIHLLLISSRVILLAS